MPDIAAIFLKVSTKSDRLHTHAGCAEKSPASRRADDRCQHPQRQGIPPGWSATNVVADVFPSPSRRDSRRGFLRSGRLELAELGDVLRRVVIEVGSRRDRSMASPPHLHEQIVRQLADVVKPELVGPRVQSCYRDRVWSTGFSTGCAEQACASSGYPWSRQTAGRTRRGPRARKSACIAGPLLKSMAVLPLRRL
jgi:hypothetical protein